MNIILDCETMTINHDICDIAWALVDRNKILKVKNFIVKEHLSLMAKGQFSAPKMAQTMAEVANGNAIIAEWDEIAAELLDDMDRANNFYAYNAAFDRTALIKTSKLLQSEFTAEFENSDRYDKWRCLWAWATNTILFKKSYIDWCEVNGFVSEKGNTKTSAETCIRFIRNDPEYIEAHTARADVLDEFEIYLTIKRAVKREFTDEVPDPDSFKGTWHNVARLKKAIES
jgi:DNA polymerase III epsilon subunit-like protein